MADADKEQAGRPWQLDELAHALVRLDKAVLHLEMLSGPESLLSNAAFRKVALAMTHIETAQLWLRDIDSVQMVECPPDTAPGPQR